MPRPSLLIKIALFAFALGGNASAHELHTTLALDATHSNNARLNPSPNEISDYWLSPNVDIDYALLFPSLTASLRYRAGRTYYHNHSYPDRTDILGSGSLQWTISDQRLYWDFQQNSSRLTIDSRALDTPSNQTNRNVVSTGPVLQLNPSTNSTLKLNANYNSVTFNGGGLASTDQRQYGIDYSLNLNTQSSVGLTAQYLDASSKDAILDYKSERVGVTLNSVGRVLQYNLTLGENRVTRPQKPTFSGVFASLSLLLTTARTNWRLSANHELTDSAIGLSLSSSIQSPAQTGDSGFNVSGIVLRERYEITSEFNLVPGRVMMDLGASYNSQNYKTLPNDQRFTGAHFEFRFLPRRTVTLSYSLEWTKARFEQVSSTVGADRYTDLTNRIGVTYNSNSRLNVTVWGAKRMRNVLPEKVREVSSGLTLSYLI